MNLEDAEKAFDNLIDMLEKPSRITKAVLRLHRPRGVYHSAPCCEGCDGPHENPIPWPCTTIKVVAAEMGYAHFLEES